MGEWMMGGNGTEIIRVFLSGKVGLGEIMKKNLSLFLNLHWNVEGKECKPLNTALSIVTTG